MSHKMSNIESFLPGIGKIDYGEEYHTHILGIYKIYVEMVDRLYARRLSSNKFFLSLNTAIIALWGYKDIYTTEKGTFIITIAISGLVLSLTWFYYILSNRTLRGNAFRVVQGIENYLPIKPYYAEDKINKDSKYIGFTIIEMIIPWVFFCIFIYIIASNVGYAATESCTTGS